MRDDRMTLQLLMPPRLPPILTHGRRPSNGRIATPRPHNIKFMLREHTAKCHFNTKRRYDFSKRLSPNDDVSVNLLMNISYYIDISFYRRVSPRVKCKKFTQGRNTKTPPPPPQRERTPSMLCSFVCLMTLLSVSLLMHRSPC